MSDQEDTSGVVVRWLTHDVSHEPIKGGDPTPGRAIDHLVGAPNLGCGGQNIHQRATLRSKAAHRRLRDQDQSEQVRAKSPVDVRPGIASGRAEYSDTGAVDDEIQSAGSGRSAERLGDRRRVRDVAANV
jgi:hypothetical protein